MATKRCNKGHELVAVLPELRACECGPYDKPYLRGLQIDLDILVDYSGGWDALRQRAEAQKKKAKEERDARRKPVTK